MYVCTTDSDIQSFLVAVVSGDIEVKLEETVSRTMFSPHILFVDHFFHLQRPQRLNR